MTNSAPALYVNCLRPYSAYSHFHHTLPKLPVKIEHASLDANSCVHDCVRY